MEDNMPEDLITKYIQCFTDIRNVYSSCCRTKLDKNHRYFTQKFKSSWLALVEDSRVNLTIPNKVHYITDHFSDYFDSKFSNGEGLDPTTETCAQKQHEGVLQINAFSVKI